MPMLSCSSCAQHFLAHEAACPHCGAAVRTVGATGFAPFILLGLMLAACPADDYHDSLGDSASGSTTSNTTTASTTASTTAATDSATGSTGMTTMDAATVGSEAAYGVPESSGSTDPTVADSSSSGSSSGSSGTDTGSGSGSGSSSTAGEPLYGAPG